MANNFCLLKEREEFSTECATKLILFSPDLKLTSNVFTKLKNSKVGNTSPPLVKDWIQSPGKPTALVSDAVKCAMSNLVLNLNKRYPAIYARMASSLRVTAVDASMLVLALGASAFSIMVRANKDRCGLVRISGSHMINFP